MWCSFTRALNNLANAIVGAGRKQTRILNRIERELITIMADVTQIKADLKAVQKAQAKTFDEIVNLQQGVDRLNAKIKELEDQIATGGEVDQEVVDLVAAVKKQAETVDELIPDLPAPEPPVET